MLALQEKRSIQQITSEDIEVLSEVLQDQINLAVWQRKLPLQISEFMTEVLAQDQTLAQSITLELASPDSVPELKGLVERFSNLPGYTAFINDVSLLVSAFACLLDAKRIGLRLRALNKAMCPRFHVDHVPLRLITCYAGVGSQWLREGVMDRQLLGDSRAEPQQETLIESAHTGDVLLAKGERWLGNEGCGLIHRSPQPVNGLPRLLLTLDWLD